MRKDIIGGVGLILMLLTTQGAAQTERPPALPQRAPPRPPAPAAATSPYCIFESKEYSIGAVLCVSSLMSQVCSASDNEHSRPWWSSGQQQLCAETAPAHAPVEPPARAPVQPSIPAQPPIPKSQP
jgi:hypothetical protein